MENVCVEIVRYKLNTPDNKEPYLKAVQALDRVLPQMDGFVSRKVYYCQEAELWTEVVEWASKETAKKAEQALMGMPECKDGFQYIDMTSVALHHFDYVCGLKA